MTRFRCLRGFLRTLVGLDDRSGGYWGIDRCVAHDIDRARWRRAMRESGRRSAAWLARWHSDPGFRAAEMRRQLAAPTPVRPALYPPDVYRELLARSDASLRPPRWSRQDSDLIIDEHGDLVPLL